MRPFLYICALFLFFLFHFSDCFSPKAVPWVAAITHKIQGIGARLAAFDQMKARAVAAEGELKSIKDQNEVLSGQANVLLANKKRLEEDLDKARKKIAERKGQLKLALKQSRKDKKLCS